MSARRRLSRSLLVLGLGGALGPVALAGAGDPPPPDAIDEALGSVGISRRDVGWRPRGWWDRYPMDVPHKLRHVDDLMAQPFAVVPYVKTMGATARLLLTKEAQEKPGDLGAGALFRAVHDLGVQHRRGATRPYSANLSDAPERLVPAVLEAHRAGGRSPVPITFGKAPDFPKLEGDLEAQLRALPPTMDAAIGRLVADLVEARRWIDLAWRRVPLETRAKVAARLDLNVELTDATDYEPAIDDLAKDWDEASLWYGALKAVEALDRAQKALAKADAPALHPSFRFDHETPLGRIVILGPGDDEVDVGADGAFLVVDLGGDDRYRGRVGASSATRPLGALLDLGGNDAYESDAAAQGVGIAGVGVLVDVDGNDTYRVHGAMGQGVGQCGLGALLDLAGDDVYRAGWSGQGCGYLGIGTLFDLTGKDSYEIWCDGQGFGGGGGVGVLADGAGDDTYVAVTDPAVTKRPSGHSEGKVSCSNAQGAGMGRRGDGSDGHSWAGGLGALLDAAGKDSYVCGNWGQGVGYWFGTGFLWDGAGDDVYRGNGWCSGSGAHFCVGAVVDEAGDDVHAVKQNWGPAFGHDFTVGVLYDGAGADAYECGGGGIANSINRSVALLLEGGGDDRYAFSDPNHRLPGVARHDARYVDRTGTSLYWTEATSLALFLDVGGTDAYPPDAGSATPFADGASRSDGPGSDARRARNWSVAVDRAGGTIDLDRPSD